MRIVKWSLVILAALFVAIQLARPDRANPTVVPSSTMYAMTGTPARVRSVLDRSCRDCHSDETRWPWYSAVAPISWLVTRDVADGRRELNLSEWAAYDAAGARARLAFIGFAVRTRMMPPPSYLRLHPEARLSDDDVEAVASWTERASADSVDRARP